MSASPAPTPPTTTSPRQLGVLPQWMMATAMAVCVVMILGLLALIVAQGISSFWPRPVERVTLTSGEVLLGVPVRAKETPDGTTQHLFRVGNRDLGQTPFRWVDEDSIERRERPEGAVFVERQEWGVFLGELAPDPQTGETPAWSEFEDAIEAGAERRDRIKDLRGGALARANRALSENRQAVASANLRLESGPREGLPIAVWMVVLAAGISGLACVAVPTMRRPGVLAVILPAACLMLLLGWLERPGDEAESLRSWHEQRIADLAEERESIEARFASLNDELAELEAEDSAYRVRIMAADGTIAPESQSTRDRPMKASQVIRAFPPNALNAGENAAVFLSRWREYIFDDPREANTEGGIFPVIIGTVTVTLLLTVVVVPLGVLAALYIREYARQGLVISVLRVAINNLAGVPSIVYGIFGLGFFCYAVGGYIDGGPSEGAELGFAWWWVLAVIAASTLAFGVLIRDRSRTAIALWSASAILAFLLVAASPYFDGLFRVKLLDGEPTFGSSGLLWASLTLALLTLPVVIVSTEEAIAAVPQSLREASYGCGASRWQTISRVVLPGAMPGVMTGTILAMARGAGEVAPLMVVGAVKLAPELPIEPRFPFVFADRSFMHLGFHIFDLGFQSPDSEAARGMVWTTTLLLIVLVVTMNLTAIALRGRLRRRLAGGHF